jgi:hypothetical protein
MKIVFAKTRTHYESFRDRNRERPAHTQRLDGDDPIYDETWVSDRALAASYGARYVFLAGHRAFGTVDFAHKDTDFISLCANFGRRTETLHKLRKQFSCADNPNGTWGEERDRALKRSQCMVNIHQDNERWHEPFRFMVASCYCLPIISEDCADSGLFLSWEKDPTNAHYISGSLAHLPLLVSLVTSQPAPYRRMAANAWRLVCVEHTFRGEVEKAVEAMTGERVTA